MEIIYLPVFLRQYKKLSEEIKEETREKISLFKENPDHPFLKSHKLKGQLKGRWSFSVNFSYRIVFRYIKNDQVAFLSIGNHDVYKN